MTTQVDAVLIKLNATTEQLQREMDKAGRNVRRNTIAMRRDLSSMERSLTGLNRIASTFARSFAGAFALGGVTAGVGGIGVALSGTVQEAEKAQRQLFKLEQLVKSTGGAAGLTAEQIDEFSRSLARNTLASTEGVRDAAGVLLTFRSVSGEVFTDTLALAQDLSATLGTDLKSSVLQLGKALEDPAKGLSALTRSGVSFSEAEKDLIKQLQESGRLLEAQTAILDKVRQQVGGTGAAEAGGLSGAVDTLSQNWSEFLENIGNSGPITAAQNLITGLSQRIDTLNRLIFTSEREQFYELADRRQELLESLNRPRRGQASRQTAAIREELAEVEAEMRRLQDRNIARMKAQREAQIKSEAEQEKLRADSLASAAAETEKKRQDAVAKERVKAQAAALAEQQRFTEQLAALQDRIDPTAAATRDYLENVALLDRAWAEGAISGERYDELMQKLATDTDAVAEAERQLAEDRERAAQLIKELDTGASIRDQIIEVQRLRDLFPELADALADVELTLQEKWDAIGEGASDAAKEAKSEWEGLGPIMSSAFEDAIVSGKGLKDVLKGLGDDLLRLTTRNLITKPFEDALGGVINGATGGGGFLSSIFGGIFGGARASGGPVTAGRAYLVGERGPELFMPSRSGNILPAGQPSAAGTVVNNFSFVVPSDNVDYRRNGDQVARAASRRLQTVMGGV